MSFCRSDERNSTLKLFLEVIMKGLWLGLSPFILLGAICAVAIANEWSAGQPAREYALYDGQTYRLVWKGDKAAIFRNTNGQEVSVETRPWFKVGADYQCERAIQSFGKFAMATFWLKQI